jgi:hypothetical protein
MRRTRLAATLAVPVVLLAATATGVANPSCATCTHGFGCGDFCFGLFPHLHQHGPLYNYGPYYGYYPFTPYGPWDQYLRYNPYFYGDPYADYNLNLKYPDPKEKHGKLLHGIPVPNLFNKHSGCATCGFHHASWVHGGWFQGHNWLAGNKHGGHKSSCSTCGGVAVAQPAAPTGDVVSWYSGFGTPTQSAVFYQATPTLDPVLDLIPTSGLSR